MLLFLAYLYMYFGSSENFGQGWQLGKNETPLPIFNSYLFSFHHAFSVLVQFRLKQIAKEIINQYRIYQSSIFLVSSKFD